MALRLLKRVFLGNDAGPKSRYLPGSTPTMSEYYEGMNRWYREYRQDSLILQPRSGGPARSPAPNEVLTV